MPEVRIICSASQPDEVYSLLAKHVQISKVVIYCRNLQKGLELSKKYDKIEQVFTNDLNLYDFVRSTGKYSRMDFY